MFSKDFVGNSIKETGLYGYVYDFSISSDSIDVADIF